jgi:hypothetical protein
MRIGSLLAFRHVPHPTRLPGGVALVLVALTLLACGAGAIAALDLLPDPDPLLGPFRWGPAPNAVA